MSYTPPAGNSADLSFIAGYVAPAGNAANLFFAPVLLLNGSATASFAGVSVATSVGAASGASTLSISSGAIKGAELSVFGSTTTFFDSGYRDWSLSCGAEFSFSARAVVTSAFVAEAEATAYFERYYPPPIQGATTFAPFGGCIVSTFFYSRGKAGGVLAGAFEKQTKFVVRGLSRLDGESNSVAVASAATGASATGMFSARAVCAAQASVSGAAIWANVFGGVRGAQGAVSGSSGAAFLGDRVGAGWFSAQGSSAMSLAGAYSTVTVSPYNAGSDVVYVVTSRHEVVAYGL